MPIPPIDPLITFEEIANADTYFGRSKNVGKLFKTLAGMNAFEHSSASAVAAHCLYAPHNEPDEKGREWSAHRFERLRSGNSSVTEREAGYLHQAFAHVFSEDWAARVSLEDLVRVALGKLIARLQIEAPFDHADPTQQAFMLAAQAESSSIALAMEKDASRWGDKAGSASPTLVDELPTLHAGTFYSLQLFSGLNGGQPLVLELSDEPLSLDGELVRAQVVTDQVSSASRGAKQKQEQAFETASVPGRFHYLCLIREEAWPDLPEFLARDTLQAFLGDCLTQLQRGAELSASILSYRVE